MGPLEVLRAVREEACEPQVGAARPGWRWLEGPGPDKGDADTRSHGTNRRVGARGAPKAQEKSGSCYAFVSHV